MCKLLTGLLSKKCKLFSGRDILSICELSLLFSNHPTLCANCVQLKKVPNAYRLKPLSLSRGGQTRTDDPLLPKQMRYQLRYTPILTII